MDSLISPEYREQNRLLHERELARGEPWGVSGRRYVNDVLQFAEEIGAVDMIDYGCGSGTFKFELEKLGYSYPVAEYDPAILGKDDLPVSADLVVCTDVLEHVEPEKIDAVLKHIAILARKGIYLVIACNNTSHMLPDGRSSHLTIQPGRWWVERIGRALPMDKFPAGTKLNFLDHQKKVKIWISIF